MAGGRLADRTVRLCFPPPPLAACPSLQFFYQCVWGGVPGHTACDAGLRFHEVGGYCDYPYNVNCPLPDAGDNEEVDSLGTPAPPPPPADPWDEWNSQPQTGPGEQAWLCGRWLLHAAACIGSQVGTADS